MAVDPKLRRETHARAAKLTTGQVLDELKDHGITSLRELVEVRLKEVNAMGGRLGSVSDEEEKGSILIYKCIILADWE